MAITGPFKLTLLVRQRSQNSMGAHRSGSNQLSGLHTHGTLLSAALRPFRRFMGSVTPDGLSRPAVCPRVIRDWRRIRTLGSYLGFTPDLHSLVFAGRQEAEVGLVLSAWLRYRRSDRRCNKNLGVTVPRKRRCIM